MIGLCSDKNRTMTNYDDRDDDRNDDDNADSGSGSDGPIFDPITTPWYSGGGLGYSSNSAVVVAHYIFTPLKMCHKLLYAKFGILDWCR